MIGVKSVWRDSALKVRHVASSAPNVIIVAGRDTIRHFALFPNPVLTSDCVL
ncbi:hypothetical protein V3C99_004739, partial [Haemonchus contortus]